MTEIQPGDKVKIIGNVAGLYPDPGYVIDIIEGDVVYPFNVRFPDGEWGVFNASELERIDT